MSYHAPSEIALHVGACVEQDGHNVHGIHLVYDAVVVIGSIFWM